MANDNNELDPLEQDAEISGESTTLSAHAGQDAEDDDDYLANESGEGRGYSLAFELLREHNKIVVQENEALKGQVSTLSAKLSQYESWYNASVAEFKESVDKMNGMMEKLQSDNQKNREAYARLLERVADSYDLLTKSVRETMASIDEKMKAMQGELSEKMTEDKREIFSSMRTKYELLDSRTGDAIELIKEARKVIDMIHGDTRKGGYNMRIHGDPLEPDRAFRKYDY